MLKNVGFAPAVKQTARVLGAGGALAQASGTSARVVALTQGHGPRYASIAHESVDNRRDETNSAPDRSLRQWPSALPGWLINANDGSAGPGAWARELARVKAQTLPAATTGADLSTALPGKGIAQSMTAGLAQPLDKALEKFESGVAAGLDLLALKPGDSVAEHDAGRIDGLQLAVALTHLGCRYSATQASSELHLACRRELARFGAGKPATDEPHAVTRRGQAPMRMCDAAQTVWHHMNVHQGRDIPAPLARTGYKAILSLSAFDRMSLPEIEQLLERAAKYLRGGGGLVFQFSHSAGIAAAGPHGREQTRVKFMDLRAVLRDTGLELACLHLSFPSLQVEGVKVLPTRVVLPDAGRIITLQRADAAAMSGFDELAQNRARCGHPMGVKASGLLHAPG